MVERIGTRSWRTSTNLPSAVMGATTTAALRWQIVHWKGFVRVGLVMRTWCTSTCGLAKRVSSEMVCQPSRSGVKEWKVMLGSGKELAPARELCGYVYGR